MKHGIIALTLMLTAAPVTSVSAETLIECTFDENGWDRADWTLVGRPDWGHCGDFVQREGFIENEAPGDASPEELQGKRAHETHSSLLFNTPLSGDVTLTAKMAFAHRMAPSIVIAGETGPNAEHDWLEYREHFDVVLFDQGVNVWHHVRKDGKSTWTKAAYARFPLEKDTEYTLCVAIKGQHLEVSVAGHTFAYLERNLPKEFRAGVTACEGVNRFYDFRVEN